MGPAPSQWGSAPEARLGSVTQDAAVPSPLSDCAQHGKVFASGENASVGEGGAQAFDDDSATKWLAFSPSGSLHYALAQPCVVQTYTLTSANDFPERDPQAWTLEGSDDGSSWVVLDARESEQFDWRRQTRVFGAGNQTAYAHYRLTVTRNHAAAQTQLAEVELIGFAPAAVSNVAYRVGSGGEGAPKKENATGSCCSVRGGGDRPAWFEAVVVAWCVLLLTVRRRARR